MYIIVFGIIIIKLQISVSEPQFPPHVDLQQVGEAIFNNEKFKILKPTVHRVTDHFKEFMLRTDSSNHPAKRVFIDKNGFRHDWSGFGEKTKSLRKTDLKYVRGSFENGLEDTPESDIISKDGNDATVEDNNVTSIENENNNQEVKNNVLDNNYTVQNLNEEDSDTPESKKATTILNLFPSTKISIVKRLRQSKGSAESKPAKKADPAKKEDKKEKATKKNTETNDGEKKDSKKDDKKDGKEKDKKPDSGDKAKKDDKKDGKKKDKKPDPGDKAKKDDKKDGKKKDKKPDPGDKAKKDDKKKDGKGDKKSRKPTEIKTVVSTTFFCPYFGTITMSSFLD